MPISSVSCPSRNCTAIPLTRARSGAGSRNWPRSWQPTASSRRPATIWRPHANLPSTQRRSLTSASKGDSADGVWSRLKFEGGVHRVQRVPVTESQGRVHTSAAGVLVYPEPDDVAEGQIDESDL